MVHIIAEAGTNHNGSTRSARELIDVATRAGADSVKFQMINTWGLYLPGEYEYGDYDIKEVIRLRKSTELSDDTYVDLSEYCSAQGIEFSASIFDEEGLDLLCSLDPPYIKLASSDLNNIRLLRQVAECRQKVVLSTGMSTLEEIEKSLNEFETHGSTEDVVLMHCVSVYPARTEQTNIGFVSKLQEAFGLEVGFSDHTDSSTAAVMALALGCTWFEKHFTTDRTQVGLDHAYAMEEEGLSMYISDLRSAEKALADPLEKVSEAESYTKRRARRSLYAARDIGEGDPIADDDVLCVRPEGPMSADEIDLVVGKRARAAIHQYQPFLREYLE